METEHGYEISVVGRHHLEITDAIRDYVIEKVSKIERFTHRIIKAQVALEVVNRVLHRCDIVLSAENTIIKVRGMGENIYAAIDMASDRLGRKLDRYRKRLHEHHNRALSVIDMDVHVVKAPEQEYLDEINDEIEEATLEETKPHEVVAKETTPLKTLSRNEAVTMMELTTDSFLPYRREENRKLEIIYRRDDGDYGIIELE